MNSVKQNLPIFIGLAIPVVMVLVIAGIIYGNSVFSNTPPPTQDFVYAIGDNVIGSNVYRYGPSYPANVCSPLYYRVASGTVQKISSNVEKNPEYLYCKNDPRQSTEPSFYIHHVSENRSEKLTFEQVQKLSIDDSPKSSEGYEYVTNINRGDIGFPFFGGGNYDPSARYLKNNSRYEKMNLQIPTDGYYYGQDIFLGWLNK